MSSNEGDLVLDCVCGSGTTAVVAEKCGRRWIAADLGRFAVHTTRKRLLGIAERPTLRRPEPRQVRAAALAGGGVRRVGRRPARLRIAPSSSTSTTRTPITGYSWLHGLKQGRMVHVGTVDAPVTVGDVKQIVAEFRKAVGPARTLRTNRASTSSAGTSPSS